MLKMTDNLRERILAYVEDRRCREGGFCFYRMEEPNGSDTYFALSILHWLDTPPGNARTATYLQKMQHGDGSYDSIFAAFYSLKSLLMLDIQPSNDLWPYILKHARRDRIHPDQLPDEKRRVFPHHARRHRHTGKHLLCRARIEAAVGIVIFVRYIQGGYL